MSTKTLDLVAAVLETDATIDPTLRRRAVERLRMELGGCADTAQAARLLRRSEAARRLSCSARHIDHLHRQGHLRKLLLPGRARSCGIPESDITRLIEQAAVGLPMAPRATDGGRS